MSGKLSGPGGFLRVYACMYMKGKRRRFYTGFNSFNDYGSTQVCVLSENFNLYFSGM